MKKLLLFLTLLPAIPGLQAQHVYEIEEPGLSFEFSYSPEQDGGTVAVYDGYTYMHLFNCELVEDGLGIMAMYIPESRNNLGLFYMAGNRIDTKAREYFSALLKMEK